MNSILGMADLIGESELSVEQRRYLDTVISNGNALLELINSILDLAKVESGRLSLEAVQFDLTELTERVMDTLALRAHEKEVELAVRFATGLAPISIGDPLRLRQILTNLMETRSSLPSRARLSLRSDRIRTQRSPAICCSP